MASIRNNGVPLDAFNESIVAAVQQGVIPLSLAEFLLGNAPRVWNSDDTPAELADAYQKYCLKASLGDPV